MAGFEIDVAGLEKAGQCWIEVEPAGSRWWACRRTRVRVVAVRRWASRYLAGGEAGLVDARATRTRRVLDARWLDACER